MFEAGRLAESAKRSIVILLNKSLELEYAYIINYPRIIDQLLNIDKTPDPNSKLRQSLEALGKSSAEHFHWTAGLIEALGGEPQWQTATIDRIVDVPALLLAQLENAKASVSLFEQAKNVAEHSQDEGVLTKAKAALGNVVSGTAERNNAVRLLEKLAGEEEAHVATLKNIISELDTQTQKQLPSQSPTEDVNPDQPPHSVRDQHHQEH
ncbi:MAG: ferritin-like domain-containing protein [Dehalococcoidia bacterium]